MPEPLKQRMRAIGETVVLNLAESHASHANEALRAFSSASLAARRIHLRYRSADGVDSERAFAPYGLALHAGYWYAVGDCYLRDAIRTLRLDRVLDVNETAVPFSRPSGFDVLAHLRDAVATLPRAFDVEVLLETSLEAARRHLHDSIGVLEQTPDGIVLHNQSDDLSWFARQLASLPFDFVIRKPLQLHGEVNALAQRLMHCARGA